MEEAAARQLSALAELGSRLDGAGIEHWLFGGWAVDFYAGWVTRPHDDLDVAVWLDDLPRIVAILEADRWLHAPEPDEDGGTGYEREGVRLELTFLEGDADGTVFIPLREGRAVWPEGTFGGDVGELGGVRARLIALETLAGGKAAPRDDPAAAAKDRADFDVLSRLPD